jgi:hypothetical protein
MWGGRRRDPGQASHLGLLPRALSGTVRRISIGSRVPRRGLVILAAKRRPRAPERSATTTEHSPTERAHAAVESII